MSSEVNLLNQRAEALIELENFFKSSNWVKKSELSIVRGNISMQSIESNDCIELVLVSSRELGSIFELIVSSIRFDDKIKKHVLYVLTENGWQTVTVHE